MKIEDVKVGMHLRDPKGNVWEILDEPDNLGIPTIYVRCIEFKHPVGILPNYSVDSEAKAYVNRCMLLNREHLVVASNDAIKQLSKYLSSFNTLKVVTGLNKAKIIQFVTREQYGNVEVTLEDLVEVSKVQHLTRENIRVGLELHTASELSFTVIGYSDDGVLLRYILYSEIYKGVVKQISADLLVEWEDSTRPIPTNVLTTKDFILVE